MDILNYSNNVIHILLEFFFDTIIEFFFWGDYREQKYKIICKKTSPIGFICGNLCILLGIPRSPNVFYDRREAILSPYFVFP